MTGVVEAWALPTDEEERAQLQELGLLTEGSDVPASDAQLDAAVSEICRWLGAVQADRARYEQAEAAEVARIKMRYAALKEPLDRRIGQLEAIGQDVARRADFGPKAKSRKVGNGSYGSRTSPVRVSVVDRDAALAWAKVTHPEIIESKTVESIRHKEALPLVLQHLHATGEVAPGFEHAESRVEYFIKPDR